jgi:hypothetical protein
MRPALMHSVCQALDNPCRLDNDATIKPLHGLQEGIEQGYNQPGPSRLSHALENLLGGQLAPVAGRASQLGQAKTLRSRFTTKMSRPAE